MNNNNIEDAIILYEETKPPKNENLEDFFNENLEETDTPETKKRQHTPPKIKIKFKPHYFKILLLIIFIILVIKMFKK